MTAETDLDLPGAVRRARDYAAIFLKVGDQWRRYVPVDGHVIDDRLHLQGVQMWREGDVWHVSDGEGGHWAYRSAETAPASAGGAR